MTRLAAAIAVLLLAAPTAVPAQPAIPSPIASAPEKWGIRVVSLVDGRIVYAHNSDTPMQPASVQKLFTTAAALDALGPEWRTRTSVYAEREPDDGVVDGDLVLYGRGDPNLSDRFSASDDPLEPFRRLAVQLRASGVRRVEGGLVADESYLSGPPHGAGWGWGDLQWYFGSEVSALSFNDNLARIEVTPAPTAGAPPAVRIVPDLGFVEVVNEATTTAGGGAGISVHRSIDTSRVTIGGTIGTRGGWSGAVAVHRPALFTAAAFRRALADAGIEVTGATRSVDAYSRRAKNTAPEDLVELAHLDSQPLIEMIRVVNKRSQNLHAELLLRLLGRERGPSDLASDEAGVAVVLDFVRRTGASVEGAVVRDGSGLSRLDRVTPAMLEAVLTAMARHPHGRLFEATLPQAGVDGTLRGRLRGHSVTAKTGSLTTAKSLAGYITTRRGERLAFSVVYNDPFETASAIGKIDRLVAGFAASSP